MVSKSDCRSSNFSDPALWLLLILQKPSQSSRELEPEGSQRANFSAWRLNWGEMTRSESMGHFEDSM